MNLAIHPVCDCCWTRTTQELEQRMAFNSGLFILSLSPCQCLDQPKIPHEEEKKKPSTTCGNFDRNVLPVCATVRHNNRCTSFVGASTEIWLTSSIAPQRMIPKPNLAIHCVGTLSLVIVLIVKLITRCFLNCGQ